MPELLESTDIEAPHSPLNEEASRVLAEEIIQAGREYEEKADKDGLEAQYQKLVELRDALVIQESNLYDGTRDEEMKRKATILDETIELIDSTLLDFYASYHTLDANEQES